MAEPSIIQVSKTQHITTRKVDRWTNAAAGITVIAALGLLIEPQAWKIWVVFAAAGQVITSFLGGKGVPTLAQILQEVSIQMPNNLPIVQPPPPQWVGTMPPQQQFPRSTWEAPIETQQDWAQWQARSLEADRLNDDDDLISITQSGL